MPRKLINVKKGQISFMVPEDIPALHQTAQNILNMIKIAQAKITKENEHEIDAGFRKNTSKEFEKMFGMGSCKKTFGTRFPSYIAYIEFFEKLNPLLDEWTK